jgi:hypothetical protein
MISPSTSEVNSASPSTEGRSQNENGGNVISSGCVIEQCKVCSSGMKLSWHANNSIEQRNLIVAEIERFLILMKHEGSLPCSQEPAHGPYHEPYKSSPQLYSPFLCLITYT